MDFRDLDDPDARMEELSRRIAELPKGTISVKTINGKKRYYHQWYEGGRTCGRYIRQSELGKLEELRSQIEERRRCEEELKGIVSWLDGTVDFRGFRTSVVAGTGLLRMAQESKGLERRDCYGKLVDYLHGSSPSVCVLYGLRRTGKTTMVYQAIMDMSGDELRRTAYIALGSDNRVRDLYLDIQRLIENGYTTFFLDEVTLMPDFIRSAGVLSVVFASQGARLVMLGTDSLGFWLAGDDELYGRITMVHTTQIPYREHSRLLGIANIDDYIRYGGTLRKGEIDLEDPFRVLDDITFEELSTASRYCDRAIAHNIQNSLVRLEDSGHFAPLMDLRRAQVLTGTINRVVDDINHRFAVDVIDRAFRSNILDDAARNLAGDGRSDLRDDILMRIDTDAVVARLKESLSVKDPGESDIRISDGGLSTLREYLRAMDVISSYDVMHLHVDGGVDEYEQTIVTQPGMRFCHAQALICSLRRDEEFAEADERRRDAVERRIMDTLFGRMMEEILIHETKVVCGDRLKVVKAVFDSGEIDMVVRDPETDSCVIVEVKHSTNRTPHQRRHLLDKSRSDLISDRFGTIVGRFVIYRGEEASEDGVRYLNVEDYLRNLPGSASGLFSNRRLRRTGWRTGSTRCRTPCRRMPPR